MPASLDAWQQRFERHFSELAASRSVSEFPIFALEHGLQPNECDELGQLLRSRLAAGLPLAPHWLLWVIYATELGYGYDGQEYWFSFETETPNWRERRSNRQLRSWFLKFQQTYGGVIPSGDWAGHFKIIAWPITHAILPRYLQLQLARALYDLRHQFARLDALSPGSAGRLVAANAWAATSRFREFLQQEELAGRIVLALLDQGSVGAQGPIYAPTLERIVADLGRVHSAGEWLNEARRVVADRLRGVGRHPRGPIAGGERQDRSSDISTAPGIRPKLMLRRSGPASWSVVLEFPPLAAVARVNPQLGGFLKATRCRIAGVADTWLPAGWLLAAPQRRALNAWPNVRGSILAFEKSHAQLQHILDSECRLSDGPIWVCRVGADGIAREIRAATIRPSHEYILLSRQPIQTGSDLFAPCKVDCAGLVATHLVVPKSLTTEHIAELNRLGIHMARTLRVWPAGLLALDWDGEGYSEWLATDAPCLGIEHDHPVDDYVLRLDDGLQTTVKAGSLGQPLFVKLSPLPPGRYTLSITARRAASVLPANQLQANLILAVRDPEPWTPGTTSHSGLAIAVAPPDPTLDEFWEERVQLSVQGPAGHHIVCSVTLAGANGARLLSQDIGRFELPLSPRSWANKLAGFVSESGRSWAYQEALSGTFTIHAEELGQFRLRLERNPKPLRWICRNYHRTSVIRLIDDTALDDPPSARFFSFRKPLDPVPLDVSLALDGIAPEEQGGLYAATHSPHVDGLVFSTPQVTDGLQGLRIDPDLHELEAGHFDLEAAFRDLELWGSARLAGSIPALRRDHVMTSVLALLYRHLCGQHWFNVESACRHDPASEEARTALKRAVGAPGFAAILARDHETTISESPERTRWFTEAAGRYQVCADEDLCQFALSVAKHPYTLPTEYGSALPTLIPRLRANAPLLRGARLLAVLAPAGAPQRSNLGAVGLIW
jgi:hypothetical protein